MIGLELVHQERLSCVCVCSFVVVVVVDEEGAPRVLSICSAGCHDSIIATCTHSIAIKVESAPWLSDITHTCLCLYVLHANMVV